MGILLKEIEKYVEILNEKKEEAEESKDNLKEYQFKYDT